MKNKNLYYELFDAFNIEISDIIFVSSDISMLSYYFNKERIKFDPNILINILIEKIDSNGTLIFPTFNWDFCQGKTFDYHNTISKTGNLTSLALKRNDFRRTKHPIYSFAVYGKDKDYLCSLENKSSFGIDSPFNYFYEKNAKNLFINIDYQSSATFVHRVEEKIGVEYRYLKDFTSLYIDEDNNKSERTYSMYVRYLDKDVITTINPMHDIFVKNKCVEEIYFKTAFIRLLNMRKAYDLVELDILENNAKNIVKYDG